MDAPKFDLPNFDAPTLAFGPLESAYLTREQLGDWYNDRHSPQHEAASKLFFQGGKLEDMGFHIKDGYDADKARKTIRALLGSWAPKHEIKIGTVAVALANWFDYKP